MKVQDLAKELEMNNKELIEKINSMGIEVKSYNSNISDNDATIVRNAILNGGKSGETKIVKVAPKKSETQDNEPKVEVKRANIKMPTAPLPKAKPAAQTATPAQKAPMPMGKPVAYNETKAKAPLPMGKPVAYNETKAKAPLPMGKPVAYKSAEERAAEDAAKSGTAPAAVEAPATPAPAPKQEETPVAAPAAPAPAPAPKQEEAPAAAPAAAAPEVKKEEPKPAPAPEVKKEEPKPVPAPAPKEEKKPEQKPERRPEGRPNDRPRRDGDRPQRDNRQQGDRPRRDGDRPQRDNDRPRRDGDRPQRDNRDNRDNRGFQGRQGGNDKPDMGLAGSRQSAKHDDHSHGKDRDQKKEQYRDSRVNDGKRGARPGDERSLEKAKKGKHVKKEKPVVEEPKINMEELPTGTVVINVPITVGGFCEQTKCSLNTVIMSLMKMGIMANINQNLDEDTAQILADEIGISIAIDKVVEETVEEGIEHFEDKESDLKPRPPIVTVMGHVDHGKTSLLDAIRKTNVTAGESGGITQHIGASEVSINGQKIVFLDTPGHEAFTAMRARGAHVTDIAVLVVAADDGVMPQTIESISHAKAAGVPIIVAINKIDKPAANPDRVKQELTEHGILVEDWGGDTISVPVSAKSGEGITNLLEMILLQAEVLELKANPNRLALGTVIEARLDKSKGPVASLLVMNGTLKAGMSIVAGTCSGRIRAMTNYKGDTIAKAGPATAVEILGLTEVPEAGDEFNAVKEDRIAREIAERRKTKLREEVLARNASTTLEQLFSQIQEGEVKELNLIIKGDVQGSVGAIEASLEKLKNENVRVKIIHTGVGTVNESDVMLASTSGAVIIGFNVRPSASVQAMADRENIEIRTYSVIYNIIDDVEAAMKGMLDPEFKEVVLGQVEIRNTFKVPGVGIVGGAYVTDGKVVRNAQVRLVRDGIVIHEGKISSLKRFKDDAKEVQQGFECGIGLENYNDIKEGDVIECFELQEVERK